MKCLWTWKRWFYMLWRHIYFLLYELVTSSVIFRLSFYFSSTKHSMDCFLNWMIQVVNLRICFWVKNLSCCVILFFLIMYVQFFFLYQVNPHTHQVKLCDFGSAKVLVCFSLSFHFKHIFMFVTDAFMLNLNLCLTGRWGNKHILHLFKVLPSSWTYIWRNSVHHSHRHVVCRLCTSRIIAWRGR